LLVKGGGSRCTRTRGRASALQGASRALLGGAKAERGGALHSEGLPIFRSVAKRRSAGSGPDRLGMAGGHLFLAGSAHAGARLWLCYALFGIGSAGHGTGLPTLIAAWLGCVWQSLAGQSQVRHGVTDIGGRCLNEHEGWAVLSMSRLSAVGLGGARRERR